MDMVLLRPCERRTRETAIAALDVKVRAHLEAHGLLTTQQLKELTGLSRKFLIPLAESLDARKVTMRVGEHRVLRRR